MRKQDKDFYKFLGILIMPAILLPSAIYYFFSFFVELGKVLNEYFF